MDKIVRTFEVTRGGGRDKPFVQKVHFSTYSRIFEVPKDGKGEYIPGNTSFGKLCAYLAKTFVEGVPEYQDKGSVSAGKQLQVKIERTQNDLTKFAYDCNYHGQGKWQHTHVQNHLMKEDPKTFASEVPVWDDEMHGHIDIIRVLGPDEIVVADFKPKAIDDTRAKSQVYRYCKLLSLRTGIPIKHITGVYFDDEHCFQVIL